MCYRWWHFSIPGNLPQFSCSVHVAGYCWYWFAIIGEYTVPLLLTLLLTHSMPLPIDLPLPLTAIWWLFRLHYGLRDCILFPLLVGLVRWRLFRWFVVYCDSVWWYAIAIVVIRFGDCSVGWLHCCCYCWWYIGDCAIHIYYGNCCCCCLVGWFGIDPLLIYYLRF